jgi:hypothetical protein
VQILGLGALIGESDSTVYRAQDSRVLTLNVYDTVTLRLRAVGGAEQVAEQTLTIPVADPQCRILAPETPLYAGPSQLHRVLMTIGSDQLVVPDARDGSATWLRVLLPEQHLWVRADGVSCENVDPLQLPVDSAPPTAVPTLPPTETPTPTPTPTEATPEPSAEATAAPVLTATPPGGSVRG